MELTLAERLALTTVLPTEGNFLTLRTAERLREKLLPTDDEVTEWKIVVEPDSVRWDAPDGTVVDLEITNAETAALIDILRKLDKDESLTAQLVTCYEKFVEG